MQTQRYNSDAPSNESKLTFLRYGDTYVLDSILASGEAYGSRLPMVKQDHQRQRRLVVAEIISLTGK